MISTLRLPGARVSLAAARRLTRNTQELVSAQSASITHLARSAGPTHWNTEEIQSSLSDYVPSDVLLTGGNVFGSQRRFMSSSSADPQDFITSTISSTKVTVFSKTYCPFCLRTKQLFSQLGEESNMEVIELDEHADGSQIQNALATMTGQRSVPNVFVKGQHIGGNDDTQAAARSGTLQDLLKD